MREITIDMEEEDMRQSTYLQGSSGLHPELSKMLRSYLQQTSTSKLKLFKKRSHEIETQIMPEVVESDRYDGLLTLENVMLMLQESDRVHQKYGQYLIRPIIRALYEAGENDFLLDYRQFIAEEENGRRLSGREDRPLRVRYLIPEDGWRMSPGIGHAIRHAELHVHGRVSRVGYNARHSSFYLDSPPDRISSRETTGCSFYLAGAQDVRFDKSETHHAILFTSAMGVHKAQFGSGSFYWNDSFFRRDNHIYVPDGEDWRELLPEE